MIISKNKNGDIIYLPAGTYSENVTISKNVIIKGNNVGVNPNTDTRKAESVFTGVITIGATNGLTIDKEKCWCYNQDRLYVKKRRIKMDYLKQVKLILQNQQPLKI